MAIVNFSSIIAGANLGGLSADAKPTVNVPTGYVFLEFDTGKRWIFNAGNWYPLVEQASIIGSLAKVLNSIIGAFAVSTTAIPKTISGKVCTIHVLSGNVWFNDKATAVADATSGKLLSGMILDLRVLANLSLISDTTGATVQIFVWEE